MGETNTGTRAGRIIAVVMVLLILLTRGMTLTHNRELHPDEHVFHLAADSLSDRLLGRSPTFQEVKSYPEGAIVLQVPFHMLASLAGEKAPDSQMVGRIASVIYFTLGALLLLRLFRRYFDSRPVSGGILALLLTFSLLHIEQSRYGTGDAVSFFLLAWILLLCGGSLRAGRESSFAPLFLAAFLTGVLCAVKYPLLFFFCLPAAAAARKRGKGWLWNWRTLVMVLLAAGGFLLCSPKLVQDPFPYLYHLIARETHDYIRYGNLCEVGGVFNHLLSLGVYFLLYSGLPLAPLFLLPAGKRERGDETEDEVFFFRRVLPWALGVFFVYNLFARSLFMRTYYPFFALADLYVAAGAGEWFRRSRGRRSCVVILALLLVIRGGWNIAAMTERQGARRLDALVASAADEGWRRTTLLEPGYFLPLDAAALKAPAEADLLYDEARELEFGELVITATQAHCRCAHYILPIRHPTAELLIRRWDDFRALNGAYYRGSVYPEYYYWLFGFWVKGTTGTDYEFPTNSVYYRP